MSWLARLKSGNTPEEDASKTTETVFVVSEALSLGPLQKIEGPAAAANDPAPAPTTTVQPFIAETVNKLIDIGTVRPPGLSPLLLAASLALDASISAAETLPGNHFDSDYWPHSMAMNGTEIDQFTARFSRFTEKGLTRSDVKALAERLAIRDRETDDRRSCLECRHLSGYGNTGWRCGNWQAAGIAFRPRVTQLPADLVLQLQRCDGFATATPNAKANATPNSTEKTPF